MSSTTDTKAERRKVWMWRAKLTLGIAIPIFIETLDYTVVATAQPHIATTLNRLELQSYIGTVYLLTSTVFLPIYASIADIYGRHRALQSALLIFTIGSAHSTGAQNMPMMLAGRGIAGVGGGGLLAVVRIVLADSTSLDENNLQSAVLFLLFAVSYVTGPVIGGALSSISFRWVFGINLPITAVAMILAFFLLRKDTKGPQPPRRHSSGLPKSSIEQETHIGKLLRIDIIGGFLFIASGILMLLALNWGSTATHAWSAARVIASFVVGGILSILFIVWEYILQSGQEQGKVRGVFQADGMIPLNLFTSYDVVAAHFASFVSGQVLLVMFYQLATYFVVVIGQTATISGVSLLYFAPGMGCGSLIAMRMIARFRQPKYPIIFGTVITPVGLGLVSRAVQIGSLPQLYGFLVLTGAGVGATLGPLSIHARFSQPEDRVAIVVSLNQFFSTFGGMVGLAQCGAILNGKVSSYLSKRIQDGSLSISDPNVAAYLREGYKALPGVDPNSTFGQAIKAAYTDGSRWAFLSLIPWAGIAALLVLRLSKTKERDAKEKDVEMEESDAYRTA